ncbi:hypothetical protein ACYZT8_29330 [Pseudomonas sp. LB3P93]|jgi:hypothetical protein
MISLGRRLFLTAALWVPIVAFEVLMYLESTVWYPRVFDWKQFLTIHVLGFGALAYIAFAAWATRGLSRATEQQIVKKIWCAPLMFIPFYAVPWMIGGLGLLLFGQLGGLVMMVVWVVFLPYLLISGYVISGLTVALYRTFFS